MKKLMTGALMALMTFLSVSAGAPAEAQRYYRDGGFFNEHPYVQKALIGGGIGAVAGGLLGSEHDRGGSALRGGVLGAAAGAGYEYLRQRGIFSGNNNNNQYYRR